MHTTARVNNFGFFAIEKPKQRNTQINVIHVFNLKVEKQENQKRKKTTHAEFGKFDRKKNFARVHILILRIYVEL